MGGTVAGHGASVAFGTSTSFDARIDSIEVEGKSTEAIETTHMGSTGRTFMAGEVLDPGGFTVSIHSDSREVVPIGVEEQITLTHPVPPGLTNGATDVGAGFVLNNSASYAMGNQKATGQYVVKWADAPTRTAAS